MSKLLMINEVMKTYHSCFSKSVILEGEEEFLVDEVDLLAGEVDIADQVVYSF